MIPFEIFARWLRRATVAFLALPALIFLAGWLRWPLALAAGGVLAAALWREWRDRRRGMATDHTISWRWLLLGVALPAGVLTALSGAGGWGAGDSDWLKHDTLLRDLLVRPWPVTYESGHGPVLLVYYVAFYLPAALLGKLAGGSWTLASQALALTTFAGIALAGGWLVVLGHGGPGADTVPRWRRVVVPAAVFFCFSGLDVLGKMGVNLFFRLPVFHGDWSDIEWWAQFAQYSSNAATVFWAPQHALGGWLPLALALDDWFRGDGPGPRAGLYAALALIWSPFAAVGLLPLLAGLALWPRAGGLARGGWRLLGTAANGAGMLVGGLFAVYLLAHFQDYPLPAQYRVIPGFQPMPLTTVLPRPVLWLGFAGVEFLGFSAALAIFFRREPAWWRERALLWLATGVLLALPWFRYGFANDLVMRGGVAALFALQVLVVRMFAETRGRRRGGVAGGGLAHRWVGQHISRVSTARFANRGTGLVARRAHARARPHVAGTTPHALRAPGVRLHPAIPGRGGLTFRAVSGRAARDVAPGRAAGQSAGFLIFWTAAESGGRKHW